MEKIIIEKNKGINVLRFVTFKMSREVHDRVGAINHK